MLLKSVEENEWADDESERCESADHLNSESGDLVQQYSHSEEMPVDLVQQCSHSEEMPVSSMYMCISLFIWQN